ncbi:hypothetical protein ACFL6H_04030 [Candidatus Latescibacterota bacterium]
MTKTSSEVRALLSHYDKLLELHTRLEPISKELSDAMGDLSQFETIQTKLKEKMSIVESIREESKEISTRKEKLTLSEPERAEIRKAEEKLTIIVKRVIDQEDFDRTTLRKQGMRISK